MARFAAYVTLPVFNGNLRLGAVRLGVSNLITICALVVLGYYVNILNNKIATPNRATIVYILIAKRFVSFLHFV